VQVGDIGAIEVYAGGATVPPQFGGREIGKLGSDSIYIVLFQPTGNCRRAGPELQNCTAYC
jgi:hypothetical protein